MPFDAFDRMNSPSFRTALAFWLRLGCISFGGPAGQIALMQRELVDDKRWISQAHFNHALNYCMVLPGPEAQQLATYMGWLRHGIRGGVAAGVLFVLPSLLLLVSLSALYVEYGQLQAVAAAFWGLKAAVAVIVLQAMARLVQRSVLHPTFGPAFAPVFMTLALASFVALQFFQLSFVWIVAAAAGVGWALGHWRPALFGHAGATGPSSDPGDSPAHTRFTPKRLAAVLGVGAGLWTLPFAAIVASQGWDATLTHMAWFFTKAALVTFGGAYAVLPYVHQAAVVEHQWLTSAQMMDGLALGESTPGPLIMVVAFVGYLGGAQTSTAQAVSGALVATWFTFLPSFIFILAGGPWVEATRNQPRLTAPLGAISAAVVGVMATLAIDFVSAYAGSPADPWAMGLMVLASAVQWRFKLGAMTLLGLCAAAGWAIKMGQLLPI